MKTLYSKFLLLLLMLPLTALAQSTVTGTVRDNASGQPLPGVNVTVEGTTIGTQTDMDGNYTLSNVASGSRIVFSFLGFATNTVDYNGQSSLDVTLAEDAQLLNEVVVIGYGSVRKTDATGSVTTVGTREFNRGANVTPENLIQGRVAGVTINQTGQPGAGAQIRIRGGASLSASNDPLIVIDGLPISNSNPGGSSSILSTLNPNDIETFTVLKDASATAIYGSRASNGVIIITTKKGSDNFAVDYNFQYGSGKVANKIDVLGADEFRALVAERRPAADVAKLGTANTDWQDEIYQRTDLVDNNINVRGNLFKTIPTRLSVGNTYQEGLRLTNSFNRTTTSLAMNPSFFDNHLKFNFNGNYSHQKNRFAGAQEGAAIRFDPTQPVYDENSPYEGFFEYYNPTTGALTGNVARNPVAALRQRRDVSQGNRIYGNFEMDYRFHFLPELRAVVNIGYDQSKFNGSNIASNRAATSIIQNDRPLGSRSFYDTYRKNRLLDAYLVYKNTVGNVDFDVTGGYSYQKFEGEDFTTNDLNNPTGLPAEVTTLPDRVLLAYFGRANVSFNDKYLLTLSGRYDGSSNVDNHYKFFPGAAFAWKINEESFLKDSQTFSDLKLRLSYGVTGQQDIGDAAYLYLATQNLGSNVSQIYFGNTPVVIGLPRYQNFDIGWEETTQYNAGLDYGFFNNRLTGAVDVFYKKSDKLIIYGPVADGPNFGNQGFQNVGSFTTKGIEFAVNAAVVKTQNTNWNLNFNVTHYQREIKELLNHSDILVGGVSGGTGVTGQIYREGFNPSSFYLYKQLYDTSGAPIEGAYADLDGNGVINGDDRYIYRNADPKATIGFASSFNWKDLDFYFNLRASIGNRLYNNVNANLAQYDRLQDQSVLGNIPNAVYDGNFNTPTEQLLISDYWIEDASFLRMDNVTLGYTFRNWLKENNSVRIYAGMQNVFVITNYSGLDPEVTGGIDNTIYPRPRTILFGANIKL